MFGFVSREQHEELKHRYDECNQERLRLWERLVELMSAKAVPQAPPAVYTEASPATAASNPGGQLAAETSIPEKPLIRALRADEIVARSEKHRSTRPNNLSVVGKP